MSWRRDEEEEDEELDDELSPPLEDDEEDVEYLVLVDDWLSVRTSVPKSVQSSHSSSSAPSTFVVVSDELFAPHISHWGIPDGSGGAGINRVPHDAVPRLAGQRTPSAGAGEHVRAQNLDPRGQDLQRRAYRLRV